MGLSEALQVAGAAVINYPAYKNQLKNMESQEQEIDLRDKFYDHMVLKWQEWNKMTPEEQDKAGDMMKRNVDVARTLAGKDPIYSKSPMTELELMNMASMISGRDILGAQREQQMGAFDEELLMKQTRLELEKNKFGLQLKGHKLKEEDFEFSKEKEKNRKVENVLKMKDNINKRAIDIHKENEKKYKLKISAETASKIGMMEQAITDAVPVVRKWVEEMGPGSRLSLASLSQSRASNPELYTALKIIVEAVGRPNSGAAINEKEWKNFMDQFAPRVLDSQQHMMDKLSSMERKFKTSISNMTGLDYDTEYSQRRELYKSIDPYKQAMKEQNIIWGSPGARKYYQETMGEDYEAIENELFDLMSSSAKSDITNVAGVPQPVKKFNIPTVQTDTTVNSQIQKLEKAKSQSLSELEAQGIKKGSPEYQEKENKFNLIIEGYRKELGK